MACKDFIPHTLRFLLFLFIIIVYQFAEGVYMTSVSQMSCALSWINEDIMMAGYASLVGLTMAFPVLFRIMFRFTPREILLLVTGILIIGDYICMVSDFVPLVVFISFVCGFFKMTGTFICWSNIQLNITPTRDFAVFFPFLFTFILGCVQLVNIATGYSIYKFDWQAMHRCTIGALLLIFAVIFFCLRKHYRQGPFIPFKGIDYLGCILWSSFLMCIVFICVYGEHYDWLKSNEIPTAVMFAVISLAMSLHRAASVRHPFIRLETFKQHNLWQIFILFGCMTLMSATSSSIQNTFTGAVLGYDMKHGIDLTWGSFFGVLIGAGFCYMSLVKWKWHIRYIVLTGFVFFFLYQVMLYFLISPSTDKEMLYLPLLFKGAGLCIVYTALTYALAISVPCMYYFEAMCVIGFIRTSFGNPLSGAFVTRAYNHIHQKNIMLLNSEIDAVNPLSGSFSSVWSELQRQPLLVSLKEVYGYAAIIGLLLLIFILLFEYRRHIDVLKFPKLAEIWRMTKKDAGHLSAE